MGSFASGWVTGDVPDAADLNTIAGSWDTFTVTLTNLTVGTGGSTIGRYKKVGRSILYFVQVTLGTSPSVSGEIRFDLPEAAQAAGNGVHTVQMQDDSANTAYVGFASQTTTYVGLRAMNASGTYVTLTTTSSTVPMTWAVSDFFRCRGVYEAAS